MAKFGPVTCAGCGLLCDDVIVQREDEGVRLEPSCRVGAEWFSERLLRAPDAAAATINGERVDVESALSRAAELLRSARRPLLHGFENATVEDARAAVALGDRLGALVATDISASAGAPAVSLRGASTATLGDIRDRSSLVVIWREDPEMTHPRLLERLGFGGATPGRTLVVVDDRDSATAWRADAQHRWPAGLDLDALTGLHLLHKGLAPRLADLPELADLAAELGRLMDRFTSVAHATFVFGRGLTAGPGGQRRALALHELVRALCRERHVVTLELPGAPGTRSADDALAWQSGYGGNVDFVGGHPDLVTAIQPFDEIDVRLRVEAGPAGSSVAGPGVEVWIRTAAAGVEAAGTMHRLDGVPLTLQAPQPEAAPTAAMLLTRLLDMVAQ
jgi:formylmethanofuran dehydrogenase subunit B